MSSETSPSKGRSDAQAEPAGLAASWLEETKSAKVQLGMGPTTCEPVGPDDPALPHGAAQHPFEDPTELRQLGRYEVRGTLGHGGMGTVLEAFDRTLDRRVAIKLLRGDVDAEDRQRLMREAQALAKLSHPHVVQVFEVGEVEGRSFIAMELVEGRSLREWLEHAQSLGWQECLRVYLQAGEGLAAAHAKGLVHRDFKPSNAVIDDTGRVRVLDFGLARRDDDARPSNAWAKLDISSDILDIPLTEMGTVMGTPAYMPLEQMLGHEADARSDQFSYCVSLFEALYGRRPFAGRSLKELVASLKEGRVQPAPMGTAVPEAVRKAVLRGLAIEPQDRWPSMEALSQALERQLAGPMRRRRTVVLAIAGGLVATAVGVGLRAETGHRCDGARAQLEGIWDEGSRQRVREAILATEVSYAEDTWERVEAGLEEYASAWADKHTEVCEATTVRHEQPPEVMDLRMECLRERRGALKEAMRVLAAASSTRVEKAVELVASLPGLSRCDDTEALQAELSPPEDPGVAEHVDALRERLAQVRALTKVGAFEEALTEADAVIEEAERLEYAPLLAEGLLERSEARESVGRYAEAEQDAERGYLLAVQHGHTRVAAVAAARSSWVVGYHLARHPQGLQWGRTALALAKSRPTEPDLEALALNDMGKVLEEQGELDDALTHYQRALAIAEQALGPRHITVASSLDNIGNVLELQGKHANALIHHQRALAIREQALGLHHPKTAISLSDIGNVLLGQGKLADALAYYQHALTIHEQAFGPRHPEVAGSLNNIAVVLQDQGKLEEALNHYQRALAIQEQAFGPRHPRVAIALNNIGTVLENQGELADALTHYQRALAILEEALGPRHSQVASLLNNIALVLHQQGRLDEALAYYQRALAIYEEALGPRHPQVALSLNNIGEMLLAQDELEDALDYFRRALELRERALGPRHPEVAKSLVSLAEVALLEHDLDTARDHAERAVSIREAGETSPELLAQARFVLARALWPDRTQRVRSRTLAEQARDAYAELGDARQDRFTEVQGWLGDHRVP